MEEQAEKKGRACYSCGNYNRFYTKGFCRFDKENFGRCTRKDEITEKNMNCEFWRSTYYRKRFRKAIATKKLVEIQDALFELKQIFAEEAEESDQN